MYLWQLWDSIYPIWPNGVTKSLEEIIIEDTSTPGSEDNQGRPPGVACG